MEQTQDDLWQHRALAVRVVVMSRLILLEGDLDQSEDVYHKIDHALAEAAKSGCKQWTINAEQARVLYRGDIPWIEAVHKHLTGCDLTYEPSHLTVFVQSSPMYEHPTSHFPED